MIFPILTRHSSLQLDDFLKQIPSSTNLANIEETTHMDGLPRNTSLDFLLQFTRKDGITSPLPSPGVNPLIELNPANIQKFEDFRRQILEREQRELLLQNPNAITSLRNTAGIPSFMTSNTEAQAGGSVPTDTNTRKGAPSSLPSDSGGVDNEKSKARRERRMLSNRESARRSRKRKQEHLSTLETRVAGLEQQISTSNQVIHTLNAQLKATESEVKMLRVENEGLHKRLTNATNNAIGAFEK